MHDHMQTCQVSDMHELNIMQRQPPITFLLNRAITRPSSLGKSTYFGIKFYDSPGKEEYLLFDFTGFVGSVGGTLGLFIGISFREIVT